MESSDDNANAFANLKVACATNDHFNQHVEEVRQAIESRSGSTSVHDFGPSGGSSTPISEIANQMLTAEIEAAIFVTGVGVREFVQQAARSVDRQRILDSLADMTTIAGSAAARCALEALDIKPTLTVETAESWRDILMSLDRQRPVVNQTVALEESAAVLGLIGGLEARGAKVARIAIFPQSLHERSQPIVDFFEQVDAGDFHVVLVPTAEIATRYCFLAKHFGRSLLTSHLLDNHIVLSFGDDPAEILQDNGIKVDFASSVSEPGPAIIEIADKIQQLKNQKTIIRTNMSGPRTSPADQNAPWYDSPFMKACRGEPTDVTPIWMMRQAGRYMAEYREVRAKVSFLDLCANPQLCSEVMCTAVNKLGVDAAIIFSDLLPILVPMGCDLEFVKGDGPVIHNPVRTSKDIDRIKPLENNDELQFVMDTVTQTRNDLPADMPLIGFAGSPFTLASYMIEGGSSRNYAFSKALMYSDHGAWDQLMQHLSDSISIYLKGQIEAGAQVVQLFDSWAGCLNFEDYRTYALPYVKKIIASLPADVPVINFATGNPALLPLLADTRASVVGIDWRTRLDDAWQTVGFDRSVQGNLDPTILLTNPKEIRERAKVVLDQAAGRPGHIFNLGHGILPQTPVDNAIALVDAVHELSQR